MGGWWRGGLVLLGLFCGAVALAWLTTGAETERLPAGSSRSYAPDGTRALFQWLATSGYTASRVDQSPLSLSPPALPPAEALPDLWVVAQPQRPLTPVDTERMEAVAQRGGTVLLAGDSPALRLYLATLGITLRSTAIVRQLVPVGGPGGPVGPLPVSARAQLEAVPPAAGGQAVRLAPLLRNADGGTVAARLPYHGGNMVVAATPHLLDNAALADAATAGFVYREVIAPLPASGRASFDESVYLTSTGSEDDEGAPAGDGETQPATLGSLLTGTAPGRAVLYAAGVVFLYLVLAGRRFGPALPAVAAETASRGMDEHVRALAGLHQRAGHLDFLRAHYRDALRRAGVPATTLAAVEAARSEDALLAAVGRAYHDQAAQAAQRAATGALR